MLMQNFGVTNKEHYGMLWYFLEWSIAFPDTYLLNSGLAIGYCYPTFEQQGPGDLWESENLTKFVSTCVSLVSVSHFLL